MAGALHLLDGGLATTLQQAPSPLPRFDPRRPPARPLLNDHLLAAPEEVRAVHRRFADAGAEILLAGTFMALADLDPRWEAVADVALDCARGLGATLAASVGPAGAPEAVEALARRLAGDRDLELIVLETFVDGGALIAAVEAVRRVWSGGLVACLCPARDGRLLSGEEPGPWLGRARAAGADRVGFNCGPGVVRAARRTRVDWVKPNANDEPVVTLLDDPHPPAWIGGCCGTDPEAIATLGRRLGRCR